jgi:hypothetical protein
MSRWTGHAAWTEKANRNLVENPLTTSKFENENRIKIRPAAAELFHEGDTTKIRLETHPRLRNALRIIYEPRFYEKVF